jgi:methanol metabolism-related c-type cytochrome
MPWLRFPLVTRSLVLAAVLVAVLFPLAQGQAQDEEKPYSFSEDGLIDWYTYSGFRRYHSECHVCHGPDGLGSSFAPALLDSMKTMSYEDFLEVVVNGRENVSVASQNKMPAFGDNYNVMCFIDDLFAYLKARADGAIGRGRPAKKQAKPEEAKERDAACFG